jgi:hypothetical protein
VDGDVVAFALGAEEAELVVGAVDEGDPGAVMVRVAVVGLVDGIGDDLFGRAQR